MVQVVRTIEFPYEEWPVLRKPTGEILSIRPIKGSWTLLGGEDRRRMAERRICVKGLIACPNCGQATFLPESFDPPKELGDAKPPCEYKCKGCQLVCCIILKDWDQRKLYCVCYETRDGDSLKPHKEYLHAVDDLEAKKFFWASHGREVTNLVGLAPVAGFFIHDKNERKLTV